MITNLPRPHVACRVTLLPLLSTQILLTCKRIRLNFLVSHQVGLALILHHVFFVVVKTMAIIVCLFILLVKNRDKYLLENNIFHLLFYYFIGLLLFDKIYFLD